jgi:hypothetical protein
VQIAIEEWAGASPIYTKRMQRALNYEGDDVPTIFKGLQLDIGAPPQFMDFRYTIHDRWHGEFHLDHCGALLDVEPMGDEYVFGMCHTIEDPTFDATAVATNPRCVPSYPPGSVRQSALRDRHHRRGPPVAAQSIPVLGSFGKPVLRHGNSTIDRSDDGLADYSGHRSPTSTSMPFPTRRWWMADEVPVRHLLYLRWRSFSEHRAAGAASVGTRQLIGGWARPRAHLRALSYPAGSTACCVSSCIRCSTRSAIKRETSGQLRVHQSPAATMPPGSRVVAGVGVAIAGHRHRGGPAYRSQSAGAIPTGPLSYRSRH